MLDCGGQDHPRDPVKVASTNLNKTYVSKRGPYPPSGFRVEDSGFRVRGSR